jgi:hypothetical protein
VLGGQGRVQEGEVSVPQVPYARRQDKRSLAQ